ncbi:chitin deacetylase [Dinochytrium kinnereticum]|nr:chitin deacetylase [Dinochytrium kinnereticum]
MVGYPAPGAIPPPNPEWTRFYLGNAVIPRIPVRASPNPFPDYSQTITTCTAPGLWAQTFDDGPSLASNILMDGLKQQNVKTTFFNVGGNVARFPCIMKRKEAEGHMNCWSHSAMTTLTNDQIVAEVVWNAIAVRQVTGKSPKCFRPPYGDIDERVVAVLKAMGQSVVWLNMDTNDWQMQTGTVPAVILAKVNDRIRTNPPGTSVISLEHDLYPNIVEVGKETTNAILTSNKFRLVTVDQCLGTALGDGFQLPPTARIGAAGTC